MQNGTKQRHIPAAKMARRFWKKFLLQRSRLSTARKSSSVTQFCLVRFNIRGRLLLDYCGQQHEKVDA